MAAVSSAATTLRVAPGPSVRGSSARLAIETERERTVGGIDWLREHSALKPD